MKPDEKTIIQNCHKGEWSGFGELYDFYLPKVYSFIYVKTMHREVAEDISSQVFLKLIENLESFKADTNFSAWVYAIARNTVTDYYRSRESSAEVEDFWDLPDKDNLVSDLDNKQFLKKIWEFVGGLDEKKREVFLLRVWGGFSFEEISEITGRSKGSLKMDILRTLAKIRKNITPAMIISIFLA